MSKLIIALGVLGVSMSSILVRFSDASSFFLAFYRMLFASVILLPLLLIRHRQEIKNIDIKSVLLAAVSGLFLGLHFTFYFEAVRHTSVAAATVLVDTEVFFVAVGGFLLIHETVGKKELIGIFVAFAGSCIIALGDAGQSSMMLRGDLMALAGAAAQAAYTLLGKKCRTRMSTTLYTGIVYGCAAVFLAVEMGLFRVSFTAAAPKNYLIALGLTIMCTFLGHSIFNWGLKYEKATFVSIMKLMEPLMASFMALALFAEVPSIITILGGITVIGGIAYYIRTSA